MRVRSTIHDQDDPGWNDLDHPAVAPFTFGCDAFVVTPDDLRILVYTAAPGTAGAPGTAPAADSAFGDEPYADRGMRRVAPDVVRLARAACVGRPGPAAVATSIHRVVHDNCATIG